MCLFTICPFSRFRNKMNSTYSKRFLLDPHHNLLPDLWYAPHPPPPRNIMLTLYPVSYYSQTEFANKTQLYVLLPNKIMMLPPRSQSLEEINDWKNRIHDSWKKTREDGRWVYSSDCRDSSELVNWSFCFLQVLSQTGFHSSDSTNKNNWILLLESVNLHTEMLWLNWPRLRQQSHD